MTLQLDLSFLSDDPAPIGMKTATPPEPPPAALPVPAPPASQPVREPVRPASPAAAATAAAPPPPSLREGPRPELDPERLPELARFAGYEMYRDPERTVIRKPGERRWAATVRTGPTSHRFVGAGEDPGALWALAWAEIHPAREARAPDDQRPLRNPRMQDPNVPLFIARQPAEATAAADALEVEGFDARMEVRRAEGDRTEWVVFTSATGARRVTADVVGSRAIADLRRRKAREAAGQPHASALGHPALTALLPQDEYRFHGSPVEWQDGCSEEWRAGTLHRVLNGGSILEIAHDPGDPRTTLRIEPGRVRILALSVATDAPPARIAA
jgi:hypothetical protein